MGGEGSGRPPSVETIIKRSQPVLTPVGNDVFLPNYSGLKASALKQSADSSETDPIFMSLSGSLPYEPTLSKGDITASGSGVTIYNGTSAVIGTGVQIAVDAAGAEADPVFMSLSGSLPYEATLSKGDLTASGSNVIVYGGTDAVIGAGTQVSVTETDPVFMALSGGLPYAPTAKGVTNGDSHDHSGGDGAQIAYSSLSGNPTLPANEAGAANNFLSAYNSTTGAWTKAQPTWANINKATSSIADITTKSHTALSDIGTNTHAQIDTHIGDSSDPHGVTLTQTTLYGTTLSGTNVYGTTGVWGTTISGANVYSTGVFSGASVYAANITVPTSISGALFMTTTDSTTSGAERMRNILVGTEAVTALSAALYYRGTIYLKYTA